MWTAAGYSFGFSEPHIFGCLKAGRQAEWSWCVDVWWEAGRGSCCSSPWEEGHSERMSGEGPFRRSLSQSEWGGIRILLGRCACCPAIMAEINGSAALDLEIHLPCVVSSGVKLIWWHSTCNSRLILELMTLLIVENETKAAGLKPAHHMCRTTQLLGRFILRICQKCWKTTKLSIRNPHVQERKSWQNVNKTKTSHRQRQIDFHQQWRLLNNVFSDHCSVY